MYWNLTRKEDFTRKELSNSFQMIIFLRHASAIPQPLSIMHLNVRVPMCTFVLDGHLDVTQIQKSTKILAAYPLVGPRTLFKIKLRRE